MDKNSIMLDPEWYEMVRASYRNGKTHAVMNDPVEKIESHDNALCMYDYATEILDEIEGDLK